MPYKEVIFSITSGIGYVYSYDTHGFNCFLKELQLANDEIDSILRLQKYIKLGNMMIMELGGSEDIHFVK